MKYKTEMVSPKKAAEYISSGTKNRRIKKSKIKQFVTDMVKEKWAETGEPLIFDEKGRMIDGFHRCTAAVQSKKPFKTVVVRGVENKNFVYIDSGSSRSAGDVLSADGFTQDRSIAAAIKVINAITRLEKGASKGKHRIRWSSKIDHATTLRFARANRKRLEEAASVVRNKKGARKLLTPHGAFIALFFLFAKKGGIGKAREFFDSLVTGENLTSRDPILKIREHLFDIKGQRGIHYSTIAAVTIKGWNSWIKGQSLSVLAYDKESEEWPRIEKA